jgi:hypothetical protein
MNTAVRLKKREERHIAQHIIVSMGITLMLTFTRNQADNLIKPQEPAFNLRALIFLSILKALFQRCIIHGKNFACRCVLFVAGFSDGTK